ncbi:programmed cell death 1 ligand 1 [Phyllopteryx taeniolatus]|uniref:programmed cell death 1 ligand 1 n=1 Tax=Phyllopteryx taeniolatus TaxID=161469 RepID=UPI002AD1FB2D|nr:programmed cell death 1 ligand 1 [Phyllopteryx taeniolatus]
MTMSSVGIRLWLLTVVCVSGQNALSVFLQVVCQNENVGQYGRPSVVDCVIKTLQEVKDLTVTTVTWKKDGVRLLLFHNNKLEPTPGYSFADPSWNNKSLNVSLRIADTSVADHGNYTCLVMSDSGSHRSSASLRVTAKYSRPSIHATPADITPNSEVTLTCRSDGGYPKGRLGWFVGPNARQVGTTGTVAEVMRNGLFNLSSELTLSVGHVASEYTCVVFNASDGKGDEAAFTIPDSARSAGQGQNPKEKGLDLATKVVAPVVVIGSLGIGLLLYLVLSKKYPARNRKPVLQPGTDPEQGYPQDHPLVNQESQETKA